MTLEQLNALSGRVEIAAYDPVKGLFLVYI